MSLRQRLAAVIALSLGVATTWGEAPPAPMPATPAGTLPYKDTSPPFEKRAADLVGRLSLEQKAQQIQWSVAPDASLDIPGMEWWTEALHGLSRSGISTVFPQAIGMSATWDPPLMQKYGSATADEARAKLIKSGQRYYGVTLWAPTINMVRDPRWGRVEESYGEDPYLTGRLAVAVVKGMQGDDPKYLKCVATPKHFAMNSQEVGRQERSFDVADTVLHDYYLPAFRDCFVEGKAQSVMAAFNGINGVPCAANKWLLTTTLRDQWGFNGAVATDFNATQFVYTNHHYVQSEEEAIAASLDAGVDVICDPRTTNGNASMVGPVAQLIIKSVQDKVLSESSLDKALIHNFTVRMRLGMFDPPSMVPFTPKHPFDPRTDCHPEMALKMAQESFVLLKNDPAPRGSGIEKLLPLDLKRVDSIAVVGPCVSNFYYGAYSGSTAQAVPRLADTLRQAAGDRVLIRYEPSTYSDSVLAAAAKSDVVIFACGLNGEIEKEGVDRVDIALPSTQETLLEKVVKVNPNTIVVMQAGSPVGMEWMAAHVPAILLVWYPGEQGTQAMAQMLFGQVNPSGKLPLTFYHTVSNRQDSDLPPIDDYDITKGRTYMYLKRKPTYAFGHGLSYTTFEYSKLRMPETAAVDETLDVTVDVTNTGPMDGEEVVQLYVKEVDAPESLKRPLEQLKGFQRVTVGKGRTEHVTLHVPVSTLGFWSTQKNKYVVDAGVYEVRVGGASDEIKVTGKVRVGGGE